MVEADEFVGSLRAIPGVTAPVIHEGLVLMSPKHHLAISTSGLAWRITVLPNHSLVRSRVSDGGEIGEVD